MRVFPSATGCRIGWIFPGTTTTGWVISRRGFIPAILVREILIRLSPLRRGRWLFFLAVCVCLAFSAFYELLEWWAALIGGEASESFLGTQGDVWDTQWDMFLALFGAISALFLLARAHDRSLKSVVGDRESPPT